MGSGKKLYRSNQNRIIMGVCGGLGEYFNVDPTVVRLIVAIVTLIAGILPGVIGYVVASFIIPQDPTF